MGRIKKFINVKLYGWNDSTANEPIKNGMIYKVKKRLLSMFSSIKIDKREIFFQLFAYYKSHFLFYDHTQKGALIHESKVY